MRRTEPANAGRRRLTLPLTVGLLAAGAVVLWLALSRGPPQLGTDEEVFRAVDALFTAVTARDPRLLNQCDRSLRGLRSAGRLPADAFASLESIMGTARAGDWEPAARELYRFMEGQRREGDRHSRDRPKGQNRPRAPRE